MKTFDPGLNAALYYISSQYTFFLTFILKQSQIHRKSYKNGTKKYFFSEPFRIIVQTNATASPKPFVFPKKDILVAQ